MLLLLPLTVEHAQRVVTPPPASSGLMAQAPTALRLDGTFIALATAYRLLTSTLLATHTTHAPRAPWRKRASR